MPPNPGKKLIHDEINAAGFSGRFRFVQLRYVAPLADNPASFYSIGVRDSFEHPVTPLWMRFHRDTGDFRAIRQRIESSSLQLIPSGGHIWIPLEVPRELSGEPMVQALVEQVEKVVRVAYQVA